MLATWIVSHCVHVWPADDLTEHELSPACICLPAEEEVAGDDGTPRFVFTHSSLDGRELTEPDHGVAERTT